MSRFLYLHIGLFRIYFIILVVLLFRFVEHLLFMVSLSMICCVFLFLISSHFSTAQNIDSLRLWCVQDLEDDSDPLITLTKTDSKDYDWLIARPASWCQTSCDSVATTLPRWWFGWSPDFSGDYGSAIDIDDVDEEENVWKSSSSPGDHSFSGLLVHQQT